jgi:uncharacterized membrane protein
MKLSKLFLLFFLVLNYLFGLCIVGTMLHEAYHYSQFKEVYSFCLIGYDGLNLVGWVTGDFITPNNSERMARTIEFLYYLMGLILLAVMLKEFEYGS